mmetsp:Transcript_5295/g.9629  ORF Transcript_5295/g.9629 Transcript_5295/m.9629 type:complete len:201 (-) Transcript_5295:108-710(-)
MSPTSSPSKKQKVDQGDSGTELVNVFEEAVKQGLLVSTSLRPVHKKMKGGKMGEKKRVVNDVSFEEDELVDIMEDPCSEEEMTTSKEERKGSRFLFDTTAQLKSALEELRVSKGAAEAKFGSVRSWDVSGVQGDNNLLNTYEEIVRSEIQGDVEQRGNIKDEKEDFADGWGLNRVEEMNSMLWEAHLFDKNMMNKWELSC